jgi:hypothetical protein
MRKVAITCGLVAFEPGDGLLGCPGAGFLPLTRRSEIPADFRADKQRMGHRGRRRVLRIDLSSCEDETSTSAAPSLRALARQHNADGFEQYDDVKKQGVVFDIIEVVL